MTAISHRYGWTYAVLDFRPWKDGIATHKQTTYDGDTVHVRVDDALGIRFLGIDTPEKKIPLPGAPDIFVGLDKATMGRIPHPFHAIFDFVNLKTMRNTEQRKGNTNEQGVDLAVRLLE